jgi:hypothetical protein
MTPSPTGSGCADRRVPGNTQAARRCSDPTWSDGLKPSALGLLQRSRSTDPAVRCLSLGASPPKPTRTVTAAGLSRRCSFRRRGSDRRPLSLATNSCVTSQRAAALPRQARCRSGRRGARALARRSGWRMAPALRPSARLVGSGWGALLAGADLVGSLVRDRQSGSGAGSTALVHAAVAISVGTGADRVPRRPRECRVALSGGRAWPRWPAWLVALCLQRSRQRRSGLRLFSSALKRQLSTARCEAVAPATQGGRCRSARFVPKFVGFYEPVCSGSPVMAPARSRAGRRALTARWA